MTAKPKTTNTTGPDAPTAPAPEVQFVDPTTLLVDTNVRLDPRLDAEVGDRGGEVGVLVPVVAVRTSEGALRVRYGHRRTMAAVQAHLTTIGVVVLGDEADGDTAEVARIVSQWHENERRTGLSLQDRVSAVAQLSAFGVSATQIAKRTRLPRKDVDAALTVAGSELARAATARFDFLDLVQAAVVADFSEDSEAVKVLVAAARTGQFDHVAQRLRDDRAESWPRSWPLSHCGRPGSRSSTGPSTVPRRRG
jgi:ParB family chromosome partitioning protein